MSRRNARLTPRGRALLVERALRWGRPVAHVGKERVVSRQCAHRWRRHLSEPVSGLLDRPSWPWRSPTRTATQLNQRVLQVRREQRRGPERIGAELGIRSAQSALSWQALQPTTGGLPPALRGNSRAGLSRLAYSPRHTGSPERQRPHDSGRRHPPGNSLGRTAAGVSRCSAASVDLAARRRACHASREGLTLSWRSEVKFFAARGVVHCANRV